VFITCISNCEGKAKVESGHALLNEENPQPICPVVLSMPIHLGLVESLLIMRKEVRLVF
jgi:hypothetical protein